MKKVLFIAVNMDYYKIFIFLFVSSTCTGKVLSNQCYLINYVVASIANKTDNWKMDHVNKENVAPLHYPLFHAWIEEDCTKKGKNSLIRKISKLDWSSVVSCQFLCMLCVCKGKNVLHLVDNYT